MEVKKLNFLKVKTMLKIRKHIYTDVEPLIDREKFKNLRTKLEWRSSKGTFSTMSSMNPNYIVNAMNKILSGSYGNYKKGGTKDGITLSSWLDYFREELIYTNNTKLLINVQRN